MKDEAFPIALAAEITGVGAQTLEMWDRREFLKPSIRGAQSPQRSRSYSFADLVAIRVVNELHQRGMDLRQMRRIVDHLRQRKGLTFVQGDVEVMTVLISAGPELFETTWKTPLSEALQRAGQRISFVIPLGEIVAEIKNRAITAQNR